MLYIHIGLRKTGSTSIQRFCAANASLLNRNGVVYPEIGRDGANHHKLKNEIVAGRKSVLVSKLVRAIEQHPAKDFLVSSESLSSLPLETVQRLVAPAAKVTKVKAILYVRGMTSTAVSLYNQATKRSLNIMPFDDYYNHGGSKANKLPKIVETWVEAVGADGLRVRTLEAASLAGGGLLTDLLDAIGLAPALIEQAEPESMANANTAVTWESAEYIREFTARSAALLETAGERERTALASAKRPRFEVVEARALNADGRMTMVKALRPARFAHVVQDALDGQGAAPDVQYLTPEQVIELNGHYRDHLDTIKRLAPDAQLSHTPRSTPPPRPFVPDYLRISPERRGAILDGIRSAYTWDHLPSQIRDILLARDGLAPA